MHLTEKGAKKAKKKKNNPKGHLPNLTFDLTFSCSPKSEM